MKKHLLLVVSAATLFSLAYASAKKPWDGTYTTYMGSYLVYSNDLDEKQPPTRADRKMSFMVEGQVAREIFESIGPDLKAACGASSRLRVREKEDIGCTYDNENSSSPYTCHFGLDLRTGKSIPGASC